MRRTAGRMAGCSTAVTFSLAALVTGCSASDGFMSSVALPASRTTTSAAPSKAAAALPANPAPQPSALAVTPQQRGYLDALAAGGVHPSSEVFALSIGSYICQAHAAGQTPQAVWDYVHPLVSSDMHDAHMTSMAPPPADIDAITANYIRIATDRLC
ncbi:MAG TPA: DUF732 domain-containing protein [Mycobacterium sp.]|nr:DUF732 domain-containing protein [Mycobacterium sp.]